MAVSPAMTFNAQFNVYASTSLAAATAVSNSVDVSSKFETQFQVKDTGGGTVAATNGCKVQVFRRFGAGPTDDTIPILTFTIVTVVSTANYQSFAVGPGKYTITLTNLDVTNAITVGITSSTVDSIG